MLLATLASVFCVLSLSRPVAALRTPEQERNAGRNMSLGIVGAHNRGAESPSSRVCRPCFRASSPSTCLARWRCSTRCVSPCAAPAAVLPMCADAETPRGSSPGRMA